MNKELMIDRAHRFIIYEVGEDMGEPMRGQAEDLVEYLLTGKVPFRPELDDPHGIVSEEPLGADLLRELREALGWEIVASDRSPRTIWERHEHRMVCAICGMGES